MKKHPSFFFLRGMRALLMGTTICAVGLPSVINAALNINWGSVVPSILVDSDGNLIESGDGFLFEMGTFTSGFAPTANNTDQWFDNWRVFDGIISTNSSQFTDYALNDDDPPVEIYVGDFKSSSGLEIGTGYTTSSYGGAATNFNFANFDAWLWIRNGTTEMSSGSASEWLLVRSSSWMFPEVPFGCCDNELPVEWSIGDLIASDVPVWGRQGEVDGAGEFTFDGPATLQTYTIPEPGAGMLVLFGGVAALLFRRRPSAG